MARESSLDKSSEAQGSMRAFALLVCLMSNYGLDVRRLPPASDWILEMPAIRKPSMILLAFSDVFGPESGPRVAEGFGIEGTWRLQILGGGSWPGVPSSSCTVAQILVTSWISNWFLDS